MNTTRQDAWTKDEDIILAETVLRYIGEGKTQLEAFKQVAKQLSRTSAACGFRWNATIRKQYKNEIEQAKEDKNLGNRQKAWGYMDSDATEDTDKIDTAILLLKEMKYHTSSKHNKADRGREQTVSYLKKENEWLKSQLVRYEEAWQEMGALWRWVKGANAEKERNHSR